MKISASTIKTWMSCPLQVRFKEIEDRPEILNAKTSYGTCMHDALDHYNRTGDINAAIERFKVTWRNPELLNAVPTTWPKGCSYGSLKTKGIETLSDYHRKYIWDKRDIIASEHKFCVPFGDHELSGIVDLLEARPPGKKRQNLTIVDYKSGKRPVYDDLALNIQFTIYWYASLQPEFWLGFDDEKYRGMPNGLDLWEEFKDAPRKVIWHSLIDNREINVGERDEHDFGRLYRCIQQIERAIEYDVYVPDISGGTCVWCPYTDICPVQVPPFNYNNDVPYEIKGYQ